SYPRRGRRNLGDATIQVQFQIDEDGEVIPETATALMDQSSATREGSIDLFAQAAIDAVSQWRTEFVDPEDRSCARSQTLSSRFNFVFD
ncbi:MAG: hypothetical protein OXU70_08425, partial [Gammaproteobacteria bacterium]|nr:hypothetical protein [Gammaproteobacteria bacterium]